MVDQEVTSFFNEIYNTTNKRTLSYITAKCSNLSDINDILQETYMEVYAIIVKKGIDYIKNGEAFVIKIAKNKIYQQYSLLERIKSEIPLSVLKIDEDEETDIYDLNSDDFSIEDSICTNELVEEVKQIISSKPVEVQKIFFLKYSQDLSIVEIAQLLSVSQSYVKNKLYRTLTEIRKIYSKEGE